MKVFPLPGVHGRMTTTGTSRGWRIFYSRSAGIIYDTVEVFNVICVVPHIGLNLAVVYKVLFIAERGIGAVFSDSNASIPIPVRVDVPFVGIRLLMLIFIREICSSEDIPRPRSMRFTPFR